MEQIRSAFAAVVISGMLSWIPQLLTASWKRRLLLVPLMDLLKRYEDIL